MKTAVFVCFTPFHLLTAYYYGFKIKNHAKRVLIWHDFNNYGIGLERFKEGFDEICIVPALSSVSKLRRQYLKCLYAGWLFSFSPIEEVFSSLDMKKTVLFFFSDQEYVTNKILKKLGNKVEDVVLVEEGLGTYVILSDEIVRDIRWLVYGLLGGRTEPFIGASKVIKTVFVRKPDQLHEKKVSNRKIVQQSNFFCDDVWKEVFQDLWCKLKVNSRYKYLLWLGQPMEEHGITVERQIILFKEIEKYVSQDYKIVIKPHPREDESKYFSFNNYKNHVQVLPKSLQWVPVEIIAPILNPTVVLTAISSAVSNIIDLGIRCKAVYYYKILGLNFGKQTENVLHVNDNIYFIKKCEEIKNVLNYEYIPSLINEKNNLSMDVDYLMKAFHE